MIGIRGVDQLPNTCWDCKIGLRLRHKSYCPILQKTFKKCTKPKLCPLVENTNFKHGLARSVLYQRYSLMMARCYNPKTPHFDRYGGRGIVVCEEWKNNFEAFYDWAVVNGYSKDLTLDRIDSDGNYAPNNCRWATRKQQANNRRGIYRITIDEETKSLMEWCELLNRSYSAVQHRILCKKWDVIEALMTPTSNGYKNLRKKVKRTDG